MEAAKIYGLCLERIRHQIRIAEGRQERGGKILLESYNSSDIDDIIDILELYDLEERTDQGLREKLDDLAYTISVLTRETLSFGITPEGDIGLYLAVRESKGAQAEMDSLTPTLSGLQVAFP